MEEEKRDVYNKFGESFLGFDPRQDEIKLLSGIGATYIYWGVVSFFVTLPKSGKLSLNWIVIVLLSMLIVETTLCLSDSPLPSFSLKYWTEHELLLIMHCLFPYILVLLRILAEELFVDLDQVTLDALSELSMHQKVNAFPDIKMLR